MIASLKLKIWLDDLFRGQVEMNKQPRDGFGLAIQTYAKQQINLLNRLDTKENRKK